MFWKTLELTLQEYVIKNREFYLKNRCYLDFILATPSKVKLIISINRSFKTLQLLFKPLFPKMLSFQDIFGPGLLTDSV